MQKDSDAVKDDLDQLSEVGWAKRWSSQPRISRRSVSILCSIMAKSANATSRKVILCTCNVQT